MNLSVYSLLLAGAAVVQAAFPVPEAPFNPGSYPCLFSETAPVIDGVSDDACWEVAPWTAEFVDIRGGNWPHPTQRTRCRLLWDREFLFVAAELDECDLWATLVERDAVIYHDNDFELFLDPDGDNHDYYELEINALGTVWDLFLTRPYRDDGSAINAWDIQGLRSAVSLNGTLNHPGDVDQGWTVELALPWSVLAQAARRPAPPAPGDVWRLNFSRVQWHLDVVDGSYLKRTDPATGRSLPEENWVWSPQGLIAMHYPERWGLLRFLAPVDSLAEGTAVAYPEWGPEELAAGEALMQVFYAQRAALENTNLAATEVAMASLLNAPASGWSPLRVMHAGSRFQAWTDRPGDGRRLSVDETGRLRRNNP